MKFKNQVDMLKTIMESGNEWVCGMLEVSLQYVDGKLIISEDYDTLNPDYANYKSALDYLDSYNEDWNEQTKPKLSHKACSSNIERIEWVIKMFKEGKVTKDTRFNCNGIEVYFHDQDLVFKGCVEGNPIAITASYDIEEI